MCVRGLSDRGTVTFKMTGFNFDPCGFCAQCRPGITGQGPGKTHRAHGLGAAAATGPCDTGDGQRDLGFAVIERTQHHGLRHFFTDRAVLVDQCGGHAQQLVFVVIAVTDKAAFKPLAGSCEFGATGADHAAGATLGGGQHPAALQ